MKSLNDARYTMWATIIPRLDTPSTLTGNQPTGQTGYFKREQDPDSGQITTVWVSGQADPISGKEIPVQYDIPCYARGYTALGYRSSANREIYVGGDYNVTEAIQFDYPLSVTLNHQSFVTNIRRGQDPDSQTLWAYEDTGNPILWEVQGITPVHDPFGKPLRYTTVLKRAEIQ